MLFESIEHSVSRGYSRTSRRQVKIAMAFRAASWLPSQEVSIEGKGFRAEPEEPRTIHISNRVLRKEGNPTDLGTIAWVRSYIVYAT